MNEYISKPIREEQLHGLVSKFAQINKTTKKIPEQTEAAPGTTYQYINLTYMKEVSGGNIEYEKTVTQQFIEAIPEDLMAIEKAWQQQDITTLRQLAHNMKTTVSVMGINELLKPHLDAIEYDKHTEQSFWQQLSAVTFICNAAIAEAKEFFAGF